MKSTSPSYKSNRFTEYFIGLTIPIAALIALSFYLRIDPAEDAHIMFRYASHLAQGHGLVWNIGDAPVEGATEFLWTIILSVGIYFGLPAGSFAQILAIICGEIIIIIMFASLKKIFRVNTIIASGVCLIFALGPIVVQSLSGFGTSLFTLFITIAFLETASLFYHEDVKSNRDYFILPLSLLLASLTRPEGVFFSIFVFISANILLKQYERFKLFKYFLWLYIIPGGIYFIWRWNYFGWLLPNTFYAKQGGELLHTSGLESIMKYFWFCLPMLMVIVFGFIQINISEKKKLFWIFIPAVLFPWLYLLIEQMQNIGWRFQFPVLPIFLIMFSVMSEKLMMKPRILDRKELLKLFLFIYIIGIIIWAGPVLGREPFRINLYHASAIVSLLLFILFTYSNILPTFLSKKRMIVQRWMIITTIIFISLDIFMITTNKTNALYDHRVQMGKALQHLADKKYSMVTTEAGWLPYFSEWRAIDPFGLYDVHVAHHGLDERYLSLISPELIAFHVYSDSYKPVWVHNDPRWNEMTQKLYDYSQKHQYILAARIGVHHDCFWYYVKKTCPDAKEIVNIISTQENIQYTVPVEEGMSLN